YRDGQFKRWVCAVHFDVFNDSLRQARKLLDGLAEGQQWPSEADGSFDLVYQPWVTRKALRMVASIREFGFKIPILARSNGEVVDGHLRLKAACKLEIAEVPVILCDEWTPAQVKAFRLMVNLSVAWADWDEELLSLELLDLR